MEFSCILPKSANCLYQFLPMSLLFPLTGVCSPSAESVGDLTVLTVMSLRRVSCVAGQMM